MREVNQDQVSVNIPYTEIQSLDDKLGKLEEETEWNTMKKYIHLIRVELQCVLRPLCSANCIAAIGIDEDGGTGNLMSPRRCLSVLGIKDVSHFKHCEDIHGEFKVMKRAYFVNLLREHPVSCLCSVAYYPVANQSLLAYHLLLPRHFLS